MDRSARRQGLPRPLATLVALAATSSRVLADLQTVDSSHCDCFLTNGSEPAYYDNHGFYDFRSLSKYEGVPAVIESQDDTSNANVTSDYFNSAEWANFWVQQQWNNSASVGKSDYGAHVLMINSYNNIYIEADSANKSSTWLTLRTQRLKDFQTAAQFNTIAANIQYLSMRMFARTVGSSGGVTAMFTYLDSTGAPSDIQEADLEILTRNPLNEVQYTNQPSVDNDGNVIEHATQNATMPGGLDWSDWATYRMDWTPGMSTWYVNGERVANNSFQAPRDASQIILNCWSDGSLWSGNMSVGDAAYLQIQWFEIVYNATNSTTKGTNCSVGCSIDQTSRTGSPVQLWDNAAPGRLASMSSSFAWTMAVAVGMAVLVAF
jgi:hypothetical protein